MDIVQKTVVHSFEFDKYTINILALDFAGGGECYEYQIVKGGQLLTESDSGYGMREAAIRDAFGDLAEGLV